MTAKQIAQRLDTLERQVADLQRQAKKPADSKAINEWRSIAGTFAGDPLFKRAMRYGAAYRKSQKPQASARRKARR